MKKTRLAVLMALLVIPPSSLAAEKYELDDPSGRQFLPDSVNNMIDSADRFKDRLDGMGESVSNAYGNAKDRLNSLTSTDSDSDDTSAQTNGSASQAKRALGNMGSGSTTTTSARSPAYDASLDVRARQYQLDQQRNRCVTMRAGSRTQAECDLKAMCMEDDLKRAKTGYGMPTETPVMATGQCNGPNPSAAALAQLQNGNAALMGMLDGNGSSATSPLDGLMQDQQKQEMAAAEAERQAAARRQQQAAAAQAAAQAEVQRQAEIRRQAEVQRQQRVAAAQAEIEAESSGGGMDLFMGVLGAAASKYTGQAAARPTGNGYTVPTRNTNSYTPSPPSSSESSRSRSNCRGTVIDGCGVR